MSRTRQEFKALLDSLDETATVYGQAPGNVKMSYPAIRYEKDDEYVSHADNVPYEIMDSYLVTVIEKDVNTPVAKKVRQLPMCTMNRFDVVENLYHSVYLIYF